MLSGRMTPRRKENTRIASDRRSSRVDMVGVSFAGALIERPPHFAMRNVGRRGGAAPKHHVHEKERHLMMQAIRQIAQTPSSHEIRLALPREIPDNAPIEIIILVADDPDLFQRKIQQLRMAMRDQLFLLVHV